MKVKENETEFFNQLATSGEVATPYEALAPIVASYRVARKAGNSSEIIMFILYPKV